VPETVDDRVREHQRGRWRDARERGLAERDAHDAVGVIRCQGVADQHARVDADHGEPLVAEHVHQLREVVRERAGVVGVLGLVGEPDAALVDGDDLEVAGQRRHDEAPVVPAARPAVNEQQRRAVAADDGVQPHVAGVDDPAAEGLGEPSREVRRGRDGAGAFHDGQIDGGLHDVLLVLGLSAWGLG
jgi:hypothetical protein